MSFNTNSYWRKEISNEIDNAYHNGYQQGREDEQQNILKWFQNMGMEKAERAMQWYLDEQIKEQSNERVCKNQTQTL